MSLPMSKENLFIKDINAYMFNCPHCNGSIIINPKQLRCKIFRHGVYKNNGKQIKPHLGKMKCEELVVKNKIEGCGKPFRFDGIKVEICGYI